MLSTQSTSAAKSGLSRAKRNPYRSSVRSESGGPVPVVHDVPLPNGLLAMHVAVTRITGMSGWSKVETWDGPGCGLSPHDFDEKERAAPGEVMHAALRLALHLLPPGDFAPLYGSFCVSPLPDRLADLTARAMVDALTVSVATCCQRHREPSTTRSGRIEQPIAP